MKRATRACLRQLVGFTLIELLIVVAIIAILAAIAVPNFLEAQTRSKVSRAKADVRSYCTALESYRVDHNKYPYNRASHGTYVVWDLTSPVAYITSTDLRDPFAPTSAAVQQNYLYYNLQNTPDSIKVTSGADIVYNWLDNVVDLTGGDSSPYAKYLCDGYCVTSYGPDRVDSGGPWYYPEVNMNPHPSTIESRLYDPTNGTVSVGDIVRFGGAVTNVQTTVN